LPDKKIELASAFARQYNAQMYIITILNDNEEQSKVIADVFYLTYKSLKDEGFNPYYEMLSGANAPDILVQYAQQINADMILINPETNKKENSFIKRSLNNFLSPVSPLKGLMMQSNI
jgi:nucleotide-binding universal stress UspA family protein